METIITETTDLAPLVGGTFSTEHFASFELLGANHAPELNAMAYMARGTEDGMLFFAFLPYGKALIG
jgi:hypothetical protein